MQKHNRQACVQAGKPTSILGFSNIGIASTLLFGFALFLPLLIFPFLFFGVIDLHFFPFRYFFVTEFSPFFAFPLQSFLSWVQAGAAYPNSLGRRLSTL